MVSISSTMEPVTAGFGQAGVWMSNCRAGAAFWFAGCWQQNSENERACGIVRWLQRFLIWCCSRKTKAGFGLKPDGAGVGERAAVGEASTESSLRQAEERCLGAPWISGEVPCWQKT